MNLQLWMQALGLFLGIMFTPRIVKAIFKNGSAPGLTLAIWAGGIVLFVAATWLITW